MGQRGPAPTPREILKSRGSWRADLNPGQPTPESGAPPCPKGLSKPARTIWKKLIPQLGAMGVLAKIDGAQLERYCIFFARWRQCEEFIAKNGMTYPMKSDDPACYVGRLQDGSAVVGFVEYPQVKESHRLDKALKQIEASFGLTPSARTRLQAIGAADEEEQGPRLADFKLA